MATGLLTSSWTPENFYETTLSSDCTSVDTDIFLTGVPANSEGTLIIDPDSATNREIIFYSSKTATKVTCPANGRGYDGSTATSHTSGTKVIMAPIADWFNAFKTADVLSGLATRLDETTFDYVASGCVITGDAYGSTLKWSMTAGVVYIDGKRVSVSALTAQDVVASKDTYIDVSSTGTVTFTGGNSVANNAASPALAASSIRLGIIVSGANIASVASINQGQETKVLPIASSVPYQTVDSLGNLICPRDPNRKILGYRQLTSDASNTATSATAINLSTPIIVPTGRKISITVNGYHFFGSTGSTNNYVGIYEGASLNALTTRKQEVKEFHASAGAGTLLSMGVVYTPSTANVWISVSLHGDAGTKTITGNATSPIVLKVELV